MTGRANRPAEVPPDELRVYLAYLPTAELLAGLRELERPGWSRAEREAFLAAMGTLHHRYPPVLRAFDRWLADATVPLADRIDQLFPVLE